MNLKKLKQAEAGFLAKYEGGFAHPELKAIGKRHNMDRMITNVQEAFQKPRLANSDTVVNDMARLITRSSMVSMYEKPKFKSVVTSLNTAEKEMLASGLSQRLHGKLQRQQQGFDLILSILATRKLTKWSLISILPVYFRPHEEVFVKPTTAKAVIEYFELHDLHYNALPDWEFYLRYRDAVLRMKERVSNSLSPNNAAFTGFLMMAMRR
ncbi:MAG: hypothetical protein OXD01_10230 [Gammaproteobacteria bacterium]|nr:hypothetical protein [Gammaproteobacteria bacterium]